MDENKMTGRIQDDDLEKVVGGTTETSDHASTVKHLEKAIAGYKQYRTYIPEEIRDHLGELLDEAYNRCAAGETASDVHDILQEIYQITSSPKYRNYTGCSSVLRNIIGLL